MDGVIIHSNPFHKIALQQFCTKYGYDLSEDELARRIYGRTNKEWITNLFGRPLPPHELAAYAEEKESLFRRLYERDITEVAGLTSFLEKTRGLGHSPTLILYWPKPASGISFPPFSMRPMSSMGNRTRKFT
jgi:beta-phosphoglucomutase